MPCWPQYACHTYPTSILIPSPAFQFEPFVKTWTLSKNWDFLSKLGHWVKIGTLCQNWDFLSTLRLWFKIGTFGQNWDFLSKLGLFVKIVTRISTSIVCFWSSQFEKDILLQAEERSAPCIEILMCFRQSSPLSDDISSPSLFMIFHGNIDDILLRYFYV